MTAKQAAQVVTGLNTALDLVDALLPIVQELAKQGVITVEEQEAQLARIDDIRSGEAFKGSQWQRSAPPESTS